MKSKVILLIITIIPAGLFLLFTCSLNTMTNPQIPYNLKIPDAKITLPPVLHEISGLSLIDDTLVACVQDELGTVFFVNLKEKRITRSLVFSGKGDFEDIARVGNDLYVLRSDAVLFKIAAFDTPAYKVDSVLPAKNTEGLCYDKANSRLLLGCKSKSGKGKKAKDYSTVWAFNLHDNTLGAVPVYNFDLQALTQFALSHGVHIPENKKGETSLKIKISALAINPVDNRLYVLSAAEYILYVFDIKGNILLIEPLDNNLFKKAEGLSFYDNGDMLISNEGMSGTPDILFFKRLSGKK
ncbi:MAG: hypothetical protein BWY70_00606 [Bacteroidetes bacterium ADurb.Bin408]|nr:MAG: hypothetical protein BWY70_00606 [Bacteroidetes bacterium ADurb.Bin408]